MKSGGGRRVSGFSLIELMVSLVLGLLVAGAALAIFQSNQATYRSNEGLNRVQENARVAFELMSRDIRAAGGSACSRFAGVEGAGADAVRFNTSPIGGSNTEIRVVSGDDMSYRITGSTSSSVTLDPTELADATDIFSINDMIVLCNSNKTHVVRATGVNATTVSFAALPDYPVTDPNLTPSVVLARFRDVRWFVAVNDRGGNSLFVSRMGAAREEIAEGINNLRFQYLQRGAAVYAAAPGDDVVSVRMTLTLEGADNDGVVYTREASNVVSLRGRTL